MAIRSPGTLFNLLKRAKTTYQKEPVNPKAPEEQIAFKINQGLKRLKEIANKEVNNTDQAKPFVETKKGVLRNMKQYHKKLKTGQNSDANKKHLPPFLKTFTKLTIAVSLLDYNTVEFKDAENVEESALEDPTQDQLKLMESDNESAFDDVGGKPKTVPDEKMKGEALLKKIASLKGPFEKAQLLLKGTEAEDLANFYQAAKTATQEGKYNIAEENLAKMTDLVKKAVAAPKVEEKEEEEEEEGYFEKMFDIDADTLAERVRKLLPDYQEMLRKVGPKPKQALEKWFNEIASLAKAKDFTKANQSAGWLEHKIAEFRIDFAKKDFRNLASRDKVLQRRAVTSRMNVTLLNANRTCFVKGDYDQMAQDFKREKVKLDKPFKVIMKTLQKMEVEPGDRGNRNSLRKLCHEYIDGIDKLYTPEQRREPGTKKKLGVCHAALRQLKILDLAEKRELVDRLPEGDLQDQQLFSLMTQTIIEESPQGAAKPLGAMEGAGVNGAYMVEHAENGNNVLIFKPADAEEELGGGWKKGSGAIREVAAKALSDALKKNIGLDLGVSQTSLVSVDYRKLPNSKGKLVKGQTAKGESELRTGSVQMLHDHDGALRDLDGTDPTAFYATVPVEDIDTIALMDIITMNQDRHGGNILVKKDEEGQNRLLPIDHGKSMPTMAAFKNSRKEMKTKNHLADKAPQFQEPFSDAMLKKIALLDPLAVATDLKNARDTAKKTAPEAADMLSDESIMMSQRSMMILKVAAPAKLTKAEINHLIIDHGQEVFLAPPNQVDAVIQRVVKDAVDNKQAAAVLELGDTPPAVALKMLTELGYFNTPNTPSAGWPTDRMNEWYAENTRRVPAILSGRIENPIMVQAMTPMIRQLQNAGKLDFDPNSLTCDKRWAKVRSAFVALQKDKVNQQAGPLGLNAILEQNAKEKRINTWVRYEMDGMDAKVPNGPLLQGDQKLQAYVDFLNGTDQPTNLQKIALTFPQVPLATPDDKVKALNDWRAFDQLGGLAEAELRGITVLTNRADGLGSALANLQGTVDLAANASSTEGLDQGAARLAAAKRDILKAEGIIARIAQTNVKDPLSQRCDKLKLDADLDLTAKELKDFEQAAIDLVLEAEKEADGDISSLAKLDKQLLATQNALAQLPNDHPDLPGLRKRIEDAQNLRILGKIEPCDALLKKIAQQAALAKTKFDLEQEVVLQGDNSQLRQLEEQLKIVLPLIQSHPVADIRNRWLVHYNDAKKALLLFDVPGCKTSLKTIADEENRYVRNKVKHIQSKAQEIIGELKKIKSKEVQTQFNESLKKIIAPLNGVRPGSDTAGTTLQTSFSALQKLQKSIQQEYGEMTLDETQPVGMMGMPMSWDDSFVN